MWKKCLEKVFLKAAQARGVKCIFTNVRPSVRQTISDSGLIKEIKEENIAEDATAAIALAVGESANKDLCAVCNNRVFKECPKK